MLKKYRFLFYVVMSIALPKGIQLIIDTLNTNIFGSKWLTYFVFVLICAFLAVGMEILFWIFSSAKKEESADTVIKIDDVGDLFRIPVDGMVTDEKHIAMFDIPKLEEEFVATLSGKRRPIIYYALSAKEYLNWIDYTFFKFLHGVQKKLKSEIIIALHYNDKLRSTKMNKPSDIEKYHRICIKYSSMVKKIIGNKVSIITEDQFYKKNPKEYAVDFHNIYVSKILEYVEKMDQKVQKNEKMNFEEFKRKLSHVESAFPIKEISGKYRKSKRIYVLDRVTSLEIWQDYTLAEIKRKNNIVFITAKTLCYENGTYINVHNKENVPNFTDDEEILKQKIKSLDLYTQKLMFSLLNTNLNEKKDFFTFPADDLIPEYLYQTFKSINKIYHFDCAEEWNK